MTLDRLRIVLPWPDPALFPNAKGGRHWRTYQSQKAKARDDGFWAAKLALGKNTFQPAARVPVSAVFVYPDRISRDMEGCLGAIKHHVDGIAQALGVDDKIFRPWTLDDALDKERRGFVIVEIG